jgi:two-component system sensor histidine kinase DesK
MRLRLLPDDPNLRWTPYAYLVYAAFFVVVVVLQKDWPAWLYAAHALGFVAFLVLYFYGYWVQGPRLVAVGLAIAGLGVAFAPVNAGASSFFIYGGAFLGELAPARRAVWWLAGLTTFIAAYAWLADLAPWVWAPALVFTPMVGGLNLHHAEIRRRDSRLRLAQDEVQRLATVAERDRIARDLHDLLGHSLSVIVLKAELASRLAERDPARAVEEIRDVERVSREALAEVRKAVRGYRNSGFRDELARAREALDAAGVALDADVARVQLPPVEDHALALVLREAVTNVVRHARASRCRVSLGASTGGVSLAVEDDGVGVRAPSGHGVDGMRERVVALGGTFALTAAAAGAMGAARGTRVAVTVPLDLARPHAATAS